MRNLFLIIILAGLWQMGLAANQADLFSELGRLEQERQALLERFTERHPDVKIVDRRIHELRQQLQAENTSAPSGASQAAGAEPSKGRPTATGGVAARRPVNASCKQLVSKPQGETGLTNGRLKLIFGQSSGGFIDAAYLDRNGDGSFADDERISHRPEDMAAIVVSYTAFDEQPSDGIVQGRSVDAHVKVERVDIDGCTAEISGTLDYGSWGSRAFRVSLRTSPASAVVSADFEFEPLEKADALVLKNASLRVFGDFDQRDPGWRRHNSSQGVFGTKPRPEGNRQFLTWQHGGHLVEHPWYWREWSGWSMTTGPVTTREGHVPEERLEYYMQDNIRGIRVGLLEPAAVAPVEISGHGSPSHIAIRAWTPRVPARPLQDLPSRVFLKNIGIAFYETGLEHLVKNKGKYYAALKAAVDQSTANLNRTLSPALSNISNPRLPETLRISRLKAIAGSKKRGWAAEVERAGRAAKQPETLVRPASGPGWLSVELDMPIAAETAGYLVPARGGVPFPRGALHRLEQVRLVGDAGREVPVQVDRLAVWPDGSVKWLLLTTLVESNGGVQRNYRVEYGDGVTRQASFDKQPRVEQLTEDAVTVDTGALKFVLSKSGSGFVDSLWLDRNGDGRYEGDEQIVMPEGERRRNRLDLAAFSQPEDYRGLAFHSRQLDVESSKAVVDSIEVERHGPASVHLLVKGHYAYDELGRGREKAYKNRGNAFRLRYAAYAGQPYLEVKHWFVFEGNPEREMVHDLGLSFTPSLVGKRRFTTGGDDRSMASPLEGSESAGIYQDNPHSFEFWRSDDPMAMSRIEDVGRMAAGWATVSGDRQGVTFGLSDMRESYAKELAMRDRRIELNLWPKRARPLDTRRYSRQYVDGESTSFGQGVAQGVARSHELFLIFHRADDAAAAQATVAQLQRPAFIKARPEWYAMTRAAGHFSARDEKRFPKWESVMQNGLDYLLLHRDLWAWYGFYDYGDFQQRPNKNGGWGKRDGRWGWANNEALVDMWIYEQFLRSGTRDYLDAALALTRHVLNVDLINAVPYKGNSKVLMHGHRHNVNHWGDGYVGIRIAAPQGFRLGYYLTGDLEIYEQLERILENHRDSMHSYDRSAHAGLGILLFFWEATGDEKYLKPLNAYLDFQVAHDKKFGHIANPVWKFTVDSWSGELEKSHGGAPTIFFFQNFGSAYTLMELADLTGRQDVIDALVRFARRTIEDRVKKWESVYCHYRLMAFAYRHSGDEAFLDFAQEKSRRLNVPGDRERWPGISALAAFDNKLSMLAWTSHGLPFLMESIKLRGGSLEAGRRESDMNVGGRVDSQGARGSAESRVTGAWLGRTTGPIRVSTAKKGRAQREPDANSWVVQEPEVAGGTLAHLVYLPGQRAMLYWGYPAKGSARYDVEAFDLQRRAWVEQMPFWSQGKLPPNPHQSRGSLVTTFRGEGESMRPGLPAINRPYWIAGQACYVPTLDKVLYFAGGATFLYDPGKRTWEDLAIPLAQSPPDVMLGSLSWDPVKERVILFGGGYISAYKGEHDTPWNAETWDRAAKRSTWAFDPKTKTWEQLITGSTRLHELCEQANALFERMNHEIAAVRSHALQTVAVSNVPGRREVGDHIRALSAASDRLSKALVSASGLADAYEKERATAAAALLQQVKSELVQAADTLASDSWKTFHLLEHARWVLHDATEELAPSPPPRYYGHMVTDAKNEVIVLFGGHGGNRVFGDTWIFEPARNQWRKSQSPTHPPLMRRPAVAFDAKRGVVFLFASSRGWVFDVAKDRWATVEIDVPKALSSGWTSIEYAPDEDLFVAVSTGQNLFKAESRHTALLKLDLGSAGVPDPEKYGGPTWSWLNPKYEESIASLPRNDADYQARISRQAAFLTALPDNEWRRVPDPAYVAQDRSYGSFTYDWDRGRVVLWGGGHSAYMGNEVSQYDVKSNTWLESWAPDMPPWPFGSPDGDGWNPPLYHRRGSAHGYHNYTYNSDSKNVAFYAGRSFYDPDLMRWDSRALKRIGKGAGGVMVEMSGSQGLLAATAKYYRGAPFGVSEGNLDEGTLARIPGSDTPIRSNDRAKPVYDSNRDRILWFGVRSGDNKKNNELWAFDLKKKRWSNLSPKILGTDSPAPENRQWGNTFSPKHDMIMLLPGNQGTWIYDAARNELRRIGPHPPNSQWSTKGVVYDAQLDVFIALTQGRYGVGPVGVWVFRYVSEGAS